MGELRPIMRPAELRRAVSEWAAQGFAVTVEPDGTIRVQPPVPVPATDPLDLLDLRR